MKFLTIMLLAVGCASHHHPPYMPVAGDNLDQFRNNLGEPTDCAVIGDSSYCKWKTKAEVYLFKNNALVSTLTVPQEVLKYQVHSQCLAAGSLNTKKIALVPGLKKLHTKSIEWRSSALPIEKVVKAAGYEVVQTSTGEKLKLKFGTKELPQNHVERYLNISAENKDGEVWNSSVTSVGTDRDFAKLLPVLLTAAYDCVQTPGNKTISRVISDDELSVQAMRHYLK